MARYQTDLLDINFNLFTVNKIQNFSEEFDESSLKEVLSEFDKFVANEIFPTREKGDVEGVSFKEGKVCVPECFHKPHQLFYENGWFALGYPEEIGGMPTPHALAVACTSLAVGANVSFSMYYGLSKGVMNVILAVGSKEQKEKYVPKFMDGSWGGTMCLTEPGAGSDVGAAITTATRLPNGNYSIKGGKIFISSGESDLYENNIHLVLARTPGAPEGVKGLSLFIVPRFNLESGDSNFVKCAKLEEKMGIHAQATCELLFGEDGECVGELIGKENDGMMNMFIMMNEARLLCGVQGESQANLATLLTEQYIQERSQFGTEIKNHPDVQKTFLLMRAMSRGMRALSLYVANLMDFAERGDKQALQELSLLTPVCKSYMTDEGFKVVVDAVQLHGGYGYCREYGMEQFIRDLKIASIYEGTNGIQAIDFVMRKILKDSGKLFLYIGEKIQKTMKRKEAEIFSHELSMMGKSMERTEEILKKFVEWAMSKKTNKVLIHATDFLRYCGHIVIGWRLLEHACEAKKMLAESSSETHSKFYESKIEDFKVFCQFKLIENIGLANSILHFED